MRKFLQILAITAITVCFCACSSTAENNAVAKHRKIGVQMYTFHKKTLEESLPLMKKAGITGVGLTAGQALSKKYPNVKRIGPDMNKEERAYLKKLLADNGCVPVSFGVYYTTNKSDIERACAFAKDIGIPIILTESPADWLDDWEKYCAKYGIKMALHNHAIDNKANKYYDPKVVRDLIKNYKHIYACPDNGHWSRSKIDGVEGYKTLEGKIAIVHFKDQKEFGNIKNQPVVFGTGQLNTEALLAELDRQGFDGYFLIEHETNYDNNLPEVIKCAEYLKTH